VSDKPIVIGGLAIVVVALTFPFWYTLAAGSSGPPPDPEVPSGSCVRDTEYMKAHHMDLLDEWRDEVVRENNTEPVSIDGREYPKSLTRGCMSCHASRQQFCQECHSYANVEPTCWDCHVESMENQP
jgi:hypothetical protein